MVATRGNVPAPASDTQLPYIIEAPRGEPSEKPEVFAEMIERQWPNTPKLEMFAGNSRDGWGAAPGVWARWSLKGPAIGVVAFM